jgi:hypothetical protein
VTVPKLSQEMARVGPSRGGSTAARKGGRDCGFIRPIKAYAVSRWLHYQPTGERRGDGVPRHRMGHRSISLIEQLQGSAAAAFD